ncbi:hypothetical protein A0H81_02561, partial [Grifola frondosa]
RPCDSWPAHVSAYKSGWTLRALRIAAIHSTTKPMIVLLLQSALICAVTWFLWKHFRHSIVKSPLDNIPGPRSQSFIHGTSSKERSFLLRTQPSSTIGNLRQIYDRNGWDFRKEIGEKYGSVVKLHGMFGHKMLYVFDPKATSTRKRRGLSGTMRHPIIRHADNQQVRRGNKLMLGPGLLSTLGEYHRKQRKMLNPVFSINHMRHMLPIFSKCSFLFLKVGLHAAIETRVRNGPTEVDMLTWMGRTALELIGQAGLGYSFDPLVEDVPDAYGDAIKQFIPVLFGLGIWRRIMPVLPMIGSAAFRRKIVDMIPSKRVQKLKTIVDTLDRRSKDIYQQKKVALEKGNKALLQQVGEGKDLMSILLKANMVASDEDRLPEDELIGQMNILTFAAMDTTSNGLSRILHLLAQHPDIQEKLRKEITEARNGQDIAYDDLVQLPYLDAVCRETLRLFVTHYQYTLQFTPRAHALPRDIVLPLSEPIRGVDGSMINEIPIPKDTGIMIGALASNRNKAIWGEDAYEWKPERWLSPLPSAVTDAHIPGVYSNLGFKFSQLEMKVVLSLLVSAFTFELPDKPIVWNLANIGYPTVEKHGEKPQMPLKVGLVKTSA